jgi:TetR/AcrR family transcriptional regulator, transcriptional repressor for nem operon
MARQSGTKEVTKNSLLEAGMGIMMTKGYNNTGIQEVLESTGVPKGSFYYYFDSKEDFALQIIDFFDAKYTEQLKHTVEDKKLNPLKRLKAYCDAGKKNLKDNQCTKGCLIGNLSQEMSDQSEVLRAKLEEVLNRWRTRFAQCIKEGQEAGLIRSGDHVQLAEFFLGSWHGAVMRSKTTKTTQPIDAFMNIMFNQVLKPNP